MSQSVFDMPGFVPEPPGPRPRTVFDVPVEVDSDDDVPAEVEAPKSAKPRSPKPAGQSAEATEEGK